METGISNFTSFVKETILLGNGGFHMAAKLPKKTHRDPADDVN